METKSAGALPVATAPGNSLSWPAKGKLKQAFADRLTISEALETVGKLIDAYPNGKASISNSYLGNMAALLCQYPRIVALRCADPTRGVARKTKFIPTIADVVAFCEPLVADMSHVVQREDAIAAQLTEREKLENGSADPPKQTIEELREEMRARGFPMRGPQPHKETPTSVMAKLSLTREQWDAIPNANPGKWQQLCDAHKPSKTSV